MPSFFRNLFNVLFPPKEDTLEQAIAKDVLKGVDPTKCRIINTFYSTYPLGDINSDDPDDLDDPYSDPSYFVQETDPSDPRDFDDVNPDDSKYDEAFYPPILTEEEARNYRTPHRHRWLSPAYYPGEW
jgi:hypothetical protein